MFFSDGPACCLIFSRDHLYYNCFTYISMNVWLLQNNYHVILQLQRLTIPVANLTQTAEPSYASVTA